MLQHLRLVEHLVVLHARNMEGSAHWWVASYDEFYTYRLQRAYQCDLWQEYLPHVSHKSKLVYGT